jgi:hypothetical protein
MGSAAPAVVVPPGERRRGREGDDSGEPAGREPHPPSARIAPTSAAPTVTIMNANLQLP